MHEIVDYTASRLGNMHPIHLLGIGDPEDIWKLVKSGVDTFDCVSPTRLARHGSALVKSKKGKINIKNNKFSENLSPIDKNCHCSTCKNYSLAYLHHLLKAEELIVLNYITTHNIYFMNSLMQYIRESIKKDKHCLDSLEFNTKDGGKRRISQTTVRNIIKYLLYQKEDTIIKIE